MNINENTNSNEVNKNAKEGINTDVENLLDPDTENELKTIDSDYKLGWNKYSETTNGRFAMIGFFAILLIEILTHQSFLHWAGIVN